MEEYLLVIVGINDHDWKEENGDEHKHLHNLLQDVEVGVDTVS